MIHSLTRCAAAQYLCRGERSRAAGGPAQAPAKPRYGSGLGRSDRRSDFRSDRRSRRRLGACAPAQSPVKPRHGAGLGSSQSSMKRASMQQEEARFWYILRAGREADHTPAMLHA